MRITNTFILGVITWAFVGANPDPIYVTRLSTPIEFDGKVDEEEWGGIAPLELTMQMPKFGDQPTQLTEIRISYDDDYLYMSGLSIDPDASKIIANTKKRDAVSGSTQWLGIIVDSYNDNKNARAFFTTPTGLRLDMEVFNDALGTSPINVSWNAFWDVKVHRDENGWSTEMRVPFSTLAFEQNEEVTMGITTFHWLARKNEMNMYPLIRPDFGDWSAWRPSLAQDMVFKGIRAKKPFYITPYVLGGLNEINDLNDSETAYINDKTFVSELGGDIKYGLSKNWTIDLSINTDFAQVEADDQQVNLTRFNLFFPEKRLFFQERSGTFLYQFGTSDQLFYSRRIGINDDGEPQRIYGGARIVGRSGAWDMGFLSMQTATENGFRGENLSVFRAKRDIINENSFVGAMVTNQMDFEGHHNTTYGLDATIRAWGENFVSVKWAQTITEDVDFSLFSLQPSRAWVSLSTRVERGFNYGVSLSRAGEDFNPSLGFEQRDNYLRQGIRVGYNWFGDSESKLFSHGIGAGGATHWNNESGRLESSNWRIGWQFNFKNQLRFSAGIRPTIENLDEEFELSDDVVVPIGDYKFLSYNFETITPQSLPFWVRVEVDNGRFYDGSRTSATFEPTFNVSSSLELGVSYQYNIARFDIRNQEFLAHLARVKSLIMINTELSISALLQYNSLKKNFVGNVRFRYNPSEGNDLYIVWNDDINTDVMREDPYLPRSNERTILVKYSYTFKL